MAINQLINIHTGNQTTVTNIQNIVNQLTKQCCAQIYTLSTVHSGLVGEASFAIADLIGVLVEVTTPPAGQPVLEGNPPYLWNAGWMSIDNADGMLEEKRITRTAFVWLPPAVNLATSFNYYLGDGAELRVTELVVAP